MPANLPPQYYEAERRLREAKSPEDKIELIEEMIGIMPKHKGTDHLKADLRRKIAKLSEMAGKKAGGTRMSTTIPKEGAAQVAIIGLPNAGKSQLVARVTKATPTVADYPFTTTTATPGMMELEEHPDSAYRHATARGQLVGVLVLATAETRRRPADSN